MKLKIRPFNDNKSKSFTFTKNRVADKKKIFEFMMLKFESGHWCSETHYSLNVTFFYVIFIKVTYINYFYVAVTKYKVGVLLSTL